MMKGSRAGWGAAMLIGPHVALGAWLVVVPDHIAFTAAQVVTLVHVGFAVVTFPIAGTWLVAHARRMRTSRQHGATFKGVNWLLVGAVALACITGVLVMRTGTIAAPSRLHAACGVLVAAPLAAHLWLSAHRRAAIAAAGALVVSTAGGAAAKHWLPPAPIEAIVPDFSYTTRAGDLYEPAENCGECHEDDYRDWKRSIHARTLTMTNVRESMARSPDLLNENLAHVGRLIATRERPLSAALAFGACGSCHAPTSFYGDERTSLLDPKGVAAEGTGCSFCHTIREVKPAGEPLKFSGMSPDSFDIFKFMSRAPFYVSAPETVRRYLFQGSKNALARRVANWLIRWRPSVHSRDYHSPVLDDSRACIACHSLGIDSPDVPHMTYYGWEHSPFKTSDPKTTVECQDCHMVRHVTGEPVRETASMVPWGPKRVGARSHLFLGGNVDAARDLGDADLARQEHELNARAASIAITHVERSADSVDVTVSVRSELVGHYFPALETQLRYGWIEIKALGAGDAVLAHTSPPRDSQDFGSSSPLIMAAPVDPKPENVRLVAPRAAREFTAHLSVPAGAAVARLVADLRESVDPAPIASATWSAKTE